MVHEISRSLALGWERTGLSPLICELLDNSYILSPKEETKVLKILTDERRMSSLASSGSGQRKLLRDLYWSLAPSRDPAKFDYCFGQSKSIFEFVYYCNVRLVPWVANNFIGKGLPFQTLVDLGFDGLRGGIEKFDPERGCRICTYVPWWINQKIRRGLQENYRHTLAVPYEMGVCYYYLRDLYSEHLALCGDSNGFPSQDIYSSLRSKQFSDETINYALDMLRSASGHRVLSLDKYSGKGADGSLKDKIAVGGTEEDWLEAVFERDNERILLEVVKEIIYDRCGRKPGDRGRRRDPSLWWKIFLLKYEARRSGGDITETEIVERLGGALSRQVVGLMLGDLKKLLKNDGRVRAILREK